MICEIDWQAIATLITGVLAVGAAIYIGRKQTEIQRRQTKLVENDLKIQLLEKRKICVDSMREIHHAWNSQLHLSDDQRKRFYLLLHDVELLFPPKVLEKFDLAFDAVFWENHQRSRSISDRERGESQLADERLAQSFAKEDEAIEIMPQLLKDLIAHTRLDAWE